ncbi:MAG TPA: DUF58 domain-containing protein [Chitinophagaceae bacterium]|nr:DUF58 domain-containing protein [Chitinophagaceae bacterium]
MKLIRFFKNSSFYLNNKAYYVGFAASVIFVLSYFFPPLFDFGVAILLLASIAILIDSLLLYSKKKGIYAERFILNKLSNGDDNPVKISLTNSYGFKVYAEVIDELPFQLQQRDWKRNALLDAFSSTLIEYTVNPVERGEYCFGNINILSESPLRFVRRRYSIVGDQVVKVYPSYIQMRRYQLSGGVSKLHEQGVQRLRKLGQSLEFEQIKEYVRGDDYRTINWKASARRGDLMVNNFTDERSQQIYCIINKGRTMKFAFEGMTLLDYAINASLVICNTALMKQDKAGLISFAETLDSFVPADKKPLQMNLLLEQLYKQQTAFLEPDMERLFSVIRNKINQRSLLLFFTNYESLESLERQLSTLKRIAHYHLLVVIFFENTELQELIDTEAKSTEDVYIQTIAEKYILEKKLIAKELQKHGILTVLTSPEKLTISSLNKYLEIKRRQEI